MGLIALLLLQHAREAFERAIALATSPDEAAQVRLHLDRLERECGPASSPG
jgi:RNA polymerase sigma-70 factor (ECF subfamily)